MQPEQIDPEVLAAMQTLLQAVYPEGIDWDRTLAAVLALYMAALPVLRRLAPQLYFWLAERTANAWRVFAEPFEQAKQQARLAVTPGVELAAQDQLVAAIQALQKEMTALRRELAAVRAANRVQEGVRADLPMASHEITVRPDVVPAPSPFHTPTSTLLG